VPAVSGSPAQILVAANAIQGESHEPKRMLDGLLPTAIALVYQM
jgi:hypothetical protein